MGGSVSYIDDVIKDYFFVEVNGVSLRAYDSVRLKSYTNDLTLVFIHGSPGQISNWKYLIDYFKEYYRVIAYDLRGYGMSDKPLVVSMDDYIKDLRELMEVLKVNNGNAVLIGHSFGGMVAQEYASRYGVRGLVLIGSLVRTHPDIIDKIVWRLPPFLWRKLLFTENPLTKVLYRKLFFSPKTPESIYEEFMRDNKDYIESLPPHVFRYMKYFVNYDASKSVSKIKCPTLIIVGSDDKVTPPEQSKELHTLIPNSKLVVIPNAGHLVLYEKPQELIKEIMNFIIKV